MGFFLRFLLTYLVFDVAISLVTLGSLTPYTLLFFVGLMSAGGHPSDEGWWKAFAPYLLGNFVVSWIITSNYPNFLSF